jgi:hypothetical protein
MRDIDADYREAMVAEYESYKVAGRTADAAHVAATLKDTFGYDVDQEPETPEAGQGAAERADDPGAPEKAVPDAPAPRTAKKTAAARPAK